MTETVLGLLRHGQTDWNVEMRLQGISDIPLNAAGRIQVELASPKITTQSWDVILTSPLSRAVETAEIVRRSASHLDVLPLELLVERSFGVAEGLTYEEWREQFGVTAHADGSETIDALTLRVRNLLDHIASEYPGKRVLAVSHGAFIRRVINVVSGGEFPREGERFGNASLSKIVYRAENWHIEDFNPAGLGD
jgi:broad specificity phosphatase PhoE